MLNLLPRFAIVGIATAMAGLCPAQERAGIAERYPGDKHIEQDPDVLFVENFEDDLPQVVGRWSDVKNTPGIEQSPDTPAHSSGSRSVRLTCIGGENTGAHFYKSMVSLSDEPVLHLRYYVKYVDSTSQYHHAGGRLGGYHPAVPYPLGGAGIRPKGDDKFTVALEPFQRSKPPRHQFYNYWVGMKPGGDGKYYGNVLLMEEPAMSPVVYDEWMAVEIMVKINTPGMTDGEVAAWVNGRKVAHYRPGYPVGRHGSTFTPGAGTDVFPGIDFRNVAALAVNFIKLEFYSSRTQPGQTSVLMYDDVVVARSYIGPLAEE